MRENLRCNCHICRVERHLFTAVEQFPGADRFRKITTISPVLATFADARALIGHLHAQKRGEYRSPSPSEVLRAIIETGRDIGDMEMSQCVLVLAFMPTIHRTYREIRAWFRDQTAAQVKAANASAKQQIEKFRSEYPTQIQFDYELDRKAMREPFLVSAIFHDDRFTYIKCAASEKPAIYEVKDGKPNLINFDLDNGMYIVPKILDAGYLAIGKKKVSFTRHQQ